MPTIPIAEARRGAVIATADDRMWLVLDWGLGPRPHGFYPPVELVLQPLPSGPIQEKRFFGGRDCVELVATESHTLQFVCRQEGELLLLDLVSSEVHSLPENRTSLSALNVEPGAMVNVNFLQGRPLWLMGLSAVSGENSVSAVNLPC